MPNHIANQITSPHLDQIAAFLKSNESDVDFNKVIPAPDNMFKEDLSSEDKQRLDREGIPNWYDWQINHWGTKWNAYSIEITEYGIYFETAWSFPEPIMRALAEALPDVEFTWKYADEDWGNNLALIRKQAGGTPTIAKPDGCLTCFARGIFDTKGYPDD